jgi:hypothetical protein
LSSGTMRLSLSIYPLPKRVSGFRDPIYNRPIDSQLRFEYRQQEVSALDTFHTHSKAPPILTFYSDCLALMTIKKVDLDRIGGVLNKIAILRDLVSERTAGNLDAETFEIRFGERCNRFGWISEMADFYDQSRSGYEDLDSLRLAISIYRYLGDKLGDLLSPVSNEQSDQQIPTSLRKSVLVRDNASCQICGRRWVLPLSAYSDLDPPVSSPGRYGENRRLYEWNRGPRMDHIIPSFYGGPSAGWNIWVLCFACNQRKGKQLWPPAIRLALKRLQSESPYLPLERPDEEFNAIAALG